MIKNNLFYSFFQYNETNGNSYRGGFFMITHFQWKPLFKDHTLPGWKISFYVNKQHYQAIYHKDGQIEWKNIQPSDHLEAELKQAIHELMLFHVYE